MIEPYSFTSQERSAGFRECMNRVKQLLDDADILMKNGGSLSTITGLYTFAIEEYGKALFIQKQETLDSNLFGKVGPSKRENIHNIKSKQAMNVLPDYCTIIKFAVTFLGSEKETVKKSEISNRSVSRSQGASGIFEDTTNAGPNVLADFDTRMRCFFVDWDNDKRKWLSEFIIEKEGLKTAIIHFKKQIEDIP